MYSIPFWPPPLHQHLHPHSACDLNSKTYPLTPDLHWHQYLHLCDVYCSGCWIQATSTNKWLHHFGHATLYITRLLCTHFWQLVQYIELLSSPLPRGHLAAFCIRFWHSPLIITLFLFILLCPILHVILSLIKPFKIIFIVSAIDAYNSHDKAMASMTITIAV